MNEHAHTLEHNLFHLAYVTEHLQKLHDGSGF